MRIDTRQNTYITIFDEDNKSIPNSMIFLYGAPGTGKTLSIEALMEEFHNKGYTVLILSDVKDNFEFGYAMFEPEKPYHIHLLQKIGKPIKTKPVKIYHPFTFEIPTERKLPEMNFYGFSIKDLGRPEWSLLAEAESESDTIRLLLNSTGSISDSDGLYSFIHYVEEGIIGKRDKKLVRRDPRSFNLRVTSATPKSMQDIASYLKPFEYNYFLVNNDSPIKLNWREILNDQENYHFFTTHFIQDEKIKQFCVLALLNQIIINTKKIGLAKKPLLIVIPEIRHMIPFNPKGYKKFLSNAIKESLSIVRNIGKEGMSVLLDSQVYKDVSEDVRNTGNFTCYGELGGESDIEALCKALGYTRKYKEKLTKMPYRSTYLIKGEEKYRADPMFTMWAPGHMHKEQGYDFVEMYKRFFPDKMKNYGVLHDIMAKHLQIEKDKVKEKIKREAKAEKERLDAFKAQKAKNNSGTGKVEELKGKINEKDTQFVLEKQKQVYLLKLENPDMSWRKVGERLDLDNKTAKKYYEKYIESLNPKKEEVAPPESPDTEDEESEEHEESEDEIG